MCIVSIPSTSSLPRTLFLFMKLEWHLCYRERSSSLLFVYIHDSHIWILRLMQICVYLKAYSHSVKFRSAL